MIIIEQSVNKKLASFSFLFISSLIFGLNAKFLKFKKPAIGTQNIRRNINIKNKHTFQNKHIQAFYTF